MICDLTMFPCRLILHPIIHPIMSPYHSIISQKREHHNIFWKLLFCLMPYFKMSFNPLRILACDLCWSPAFSHSRSGLSSPMHRPFSASSPQNVSPVQGPIYYRLQCPSVCSVQLGCTQVQLLHSPQ